MKSCTIRNIIFIMSRNIPFWKSLKCVPAGRELCVYRITFFGADFTVLPFKPNGTITKRNVCSDAPDEPTVLAMITFEKAQDYEKYRVPLQMCELMLDIATGITLNDEYLGEDPLSRHGLPTKIRFFGNRGKFPIGGKILEKLLELRFSIKMEIPCLIGDPNFFVGFASYEADEVNEYVPHQLDITTRILNETEKNALDQFAIYFNSYILNPFYKPVNKFGGRKLCYGGNDDIRVNPYRFHHRILENPTILWVTFCEDFGRIIPRESNMGLESEEKFELWQQSMGFISERPYCGVESDLESNAITDDDDGDSSSVEASIYAESAADTDFYWESDSEPNLESDMESYVESDLESYAESDLESSANFFGMISDTDLIYPDDD